jgi:hypothetical protein
MARSRGLDEDEKMWPRIKKGLGEDERECA